MLHTTILALGVLLSGATVPAEGLKAQPIAVTVPLFNNLEQSLRRAQVPKAAALAAQAARLLRWHGNIVRDLHPGDQFGMVYTDAEPPELLALVYQGSQVGVRAYRFLGDAKPIESPITKISEAATVVAVAASALAPEWEGKFYDAHGALSEPELLGGPLHSYTQITEVMQRGGRGRRKHEGLDFKAPEGTPVVLPMAGRVTRVNWSMRTNGRCVEVAYESGERARFLHLSEVASGVKPGVELAAGALLGEVGNTGRSSAPHLHYEILDTRGRPLDPLVFHGTRRRMLPAAMRAAFDERKNFYDRMLEASRTSLGDPAPVVGERALAGAQ